MNKWKRGLLAVVLCLAFVFTSFSSVSAKESFDILNHKIDVVVKENGELQITETMSVHFTERRHGIYVNIPKSYEMRWDKDDSTVLKTYFFPIKNAEVLSNHHYDTENEGNYFRFILGDEDYYANSNETYIWKYTMVTRDLDLDGLQMVFLNLITNGWDTTTDRCEFTIQFPKSIDASDIYVAYPDGMMVGTGSENGLEVKLVGNTIVGSYSKQISPKESLTLQVLLPEDYLAFDDFNRYATIALLTGGIFALISSILFLFIGKDDPVIVTAEYHTPADLDSAQAGVIINEQVNDNNVVSLLLDWGRRGIVTIRETEDDLVLKSVGALPNDALQYEVTLYEGLFSGVGEEIYVSSLEYKFAQTFSTVKQQLEDYYKDSVRELSTKKSKTVAMICLLTSWIPVTVAISILHINYYWDGIWIIPAIVSILCYVICGFVLRSYAMDVYVSNIVEKVLSLAFMLITYAGPLVYLYYLCTKNHVSMITFIAIAFIEMVVIVEAAYMRKRTIYGNAMLGRVLGLREFIMNAQNYNLEELVEENPYYFYDILPYAYSLGLDNTWNEHFKKINVNQCDWYIPYGGYSSYDHYHMMHSLDSHMQTIRSNMTSVESSEGGGGSSGGGFDGGGGFGGSSGGSW